ncbi:sensor histidine kinase [Chitinophaga pinensis]|uniref:Signal transduction histidine kinase, LytS n=1 Tax=Chitinophaga pinensis (strain ATCC 43595 / DSM 2588 / LMG 13176 / NBRC 15968 / NCIMB 11800 / UQM 2034) TaxID=485918 RepID=A0A979GAP2_CHIPD|nr:histidine kinase [Chitinophaga pinensis]ACU63811.1 signal transduction histidine kinase, LytS [Chitinophaga pinensis DSM 2588]
MKNIPVRSLVRVSLIAPLCIAILVGLTSSAKEYALNTVLLKSALMYIVIFFMGMYNLGLMLLLAPRLQYGSRNYKIIRIILSFTGAALFNYLLFRGILYSSLHTYLIPDWYDQVRNKMIWPMLFLLHGLVVNVLVFILHNYITLLHAKNHTELENARLKFANTEAINQLLRQQIHPHFLFNALNTLKSLIRRHPEKAEEYLIHLSDFLRASISKGQRDIISLKDELKLSSDYLEMQKMRVGEALRFEISVDQQSLSNKWLPAFSLQPLLENAIKHNVLTVEDPLYLAVIQEGEYLKVVNNLQIKHQTEVSTGSGLMNLTERYRMLTGEDILIEDDGKTFTVKIKILQHAGSHHRG